MDGAPNIADLVITPGLLKLVSGIDEFKGAWRAIGRIAPERLSALRRVASIESAGSSTRIEGAKLTDRMMSRHSTPTGKTSASYLRPPRHSALPAR